MGLKKHIWLLYMVVFTQYVTLYSQENSQNASDEMVYKPSIGIGLGMFTYYGDVSKNKKDNGATLGRVALDLNITQQFNPYLFGSFYFLKGKIGANERTSLRNHNFESDISIWGIQAIYNFNHFLPKTRDIEPYVSLGIESLEFLSKTDIYDAKGNLYHYWSDGSIRNLPELPENEAVSERLQRDYVYETDVRELNIDSFGKYPERTYAIPLGIGFNMLINDYVSFKMGASYHITFSDYLDGITQNSIGSRKGDAGRDNLLFTSFSLQYNLNATADAFNLKKPELPEGDIMADDEDGDGVIDFWDECPNTPLLVQVDEKGCPLDDDLDGIPQFKDEEPNTLAGLEVDTLGVALTDEKIEELFKMRNDTTGEYIVSTRFVNEVRKLHVSEGAVVDYSDKFMVRIGEFTGELPVEVAEELLSMGDVNTWEENDVTYITVGNFNNLSDALKRKLKLTEDGFQVADIVKKDNKGKITEVSDLSNIEIPASSSLNDPTDQTIFRIQIGAYRKKISKNVFKDIPTVIMLPFNDGINRYFSGSYTNFEQAAKAKVDMATKGYKGAFIVAFKNGKRISLKEAGAHFVPNAQQISTQSASNLDKKLITFSVQIGVYKEKLSSEVSALILELTDIQRERTEDGLTRYFSGSFTTYDEAERFQKDLINKGLMDAVIIGRFKNNTITAQEAIELLK